MQNLIDNAVGSKNTMQFNFLVYLREDSGEYLHKRVLYIRLVRKSFHNIRRKHLQVHLKLGSLVRKDTPC